ncbi:alpha-mannosidase [Robinsoniella peoriensis]|uniref:alpha-mannosidase n=1 Tax=Robinsoniella peoriensis TaxID=180332 RepID=UPI0005C7B64C|nr:alpha-mannosidase [Robinsoniella peoriensis]
MKVKDPHFILEKIRKYIDEDIWPTRYRDVVELDEWKYIEHHMDNRINDACDINYDDSGWQDFRLWDTWGGYDKVAWFRTSVKVPESFMDSQLCLKLSVGPRDGGESTAEVLLYINGRPVQGIDIWHEEAFLDKEVFQGSDTLHIALKAWSGVLVPPRMRTFKIAQLVRMDMHTDRFYYVIDTLLRCVKLLDEDDLRRIKLTQVLNDTFSRVNFLEYKSEGYYKSIGEALAFVLEQLERYAKVEEIKPTVYGVGHSHIDMAWLWRLCATREKASRTFSTVLNLMKQYPEYRFMHTSPQLYKFLKEDYPEIYAMVKEKIAEGQWEITGGMWVEPDTNIPSGESLVRQFVYGKRFIKEEFGQDTNLVWLPDVFGYSGALPQIMKKAGMKYFMTTKISWNQYNHFPYDTFNWKGIDGTSIFTHFITTPEDGSWFYTYNGHMDPEEVTGVWKNYKDKDKNDELLIAFGWGDGGGGPTREMLEQSRVMKNIPGIPRVEMDSAEHYFQRIYSHVDHNGLGTWDGELYFELHRGTYTSQAANKKFNRQSEVLLHNIEFLYSMSDILSGGDCYPRKALDVIWERVMLNQFHDILPGSSIRQVYEDTTRDYLEIAQKGRELSRQVQTALMAEIKVSPDSIVVYNTTGFSRDDLLFLPYEEPETGSRVRYAVDSALCTDANIRHSIHPNLRNDVSGSQATEFSYESEKLVSQQTEEGLLIYIKDIPAYGYKIIKYSANPKMEAPALPCVRVTETSMENAFYQIELNENGEISYLYDKENGRKVSCETPMNLLQAYEDKPQRFDAWDIDVYYKEKPYEPFQLVKTEVVDQGEIRGVLRHVWIFNRSVITQDMILYHNSRRIDFKTTADWKEEQVLLKVYFPVDVHCEEAVYEIQFGNIKRPTHTNNEWDFAKFEVCGHRWADLSESNYGVSILNDCKYGYDIHQNTLGLSLIKSAVRPDETADRKIHEFTYSLYPHAGYVTECEVQKEAMMLNMPLLYSAAAKNEEKAGESVSEKGTNVTSFSLLETDCGHIVIDTVKKAEAEEAYIIRLYEFKNAKETGVRLKFNIPVKRVVETNLCEEEMQELKVRGNEIEFEIGCFEIKTFKIYIL